MKRQLIALALGVSLTGVATPAKETAKLQFERTVYDFGTATEGAEVAGKFLFHNTGTGVLKINTPET